MAKLFAQEQGKVSDKAMASRAIISGSVIVSCLMALSFSAYAWFSCTVSSARNTISSAAFGVDVVITDQVSVKDVYYLADGKYEVQLTRTGNAQKGFCIVKVTVGGVETDYHTRQIPADTGLILQLNLSEPAKVEFVPSWGTSSYGTTGNPLYLENNHLEITNSEENRSDEESKQEQIPDAPIQQPSQPEQTPIIHTVAEGENLTWIAEAYDSTVDGIAEYNNIADKRTIQIGQQLKIPPSETE